LKDRFGSIAVVDFGSVKAGFGCKSPITRLLQHSTRRKWMRVHALISRQRNIQQKTRFGGFFVALRLHPRWCAR
jgi:hypothetical protein